MTYTSAPLARTSVSRKSPAPPHTATRRTTRSGSPPTSTPRAVGGRAAATGADVYLTSDLRHHVAGEFLEQGGPSLLDVSHWAAEWTWLPELAERLRGALDDTVEVRVSTICTDVWQARA